MARSLSVLVHGLSKVGKSTLAASSPKPLLYLDIEGGSRFLFAPGSTVFWEPLKTQPPVCDGTWETCIVVVQEYEEVKMALQYLRSGNHCFRAVSVDSASELQQRLIDRIGNRQQMEQRGWGEVFRDFTGLVRDFHHLTMHPTNPLESVVLVGMSRQSKEGKMTPFAQGQSSDILPYIVDVLCAMETYTTIDETTGVLTPHYKLTAGPHQIYATGSRVSQYLPPVLENATIPLLLDYVFGVQPSSVPVAAAAPAPPAPVMDPTTSA
jgi:hypothetical protein